MDFFVCLFDLIICLIWILPLFDILLYIKPYFIFNFSILECNVFRHLIFILFWNFFFFSFTLTKYLKPRSANLRWRRRLPPQPLHQPKKSLLPCQPRPSLSPRLLLPHFLTGETRLLSWRITSLTWDPSPALTTGSSTPLEESQVWYSTDELNTPLLHICVHAHFLCSPFSSIFSHSNTPLLMVSSHVHLNPDQRFLVRYVVLNFLHFQSSLWLPALCPIPLILQRNLQ